ncbi:hypothetical protein WJ038_02960 [Vibrio parahaemolyticus]|uniref:hypothetical protein n=2 Tax=Vibrio parahaemolyticus TaxID=670 RepID=UPI0004A33D67|nr:hypothetical protein [Vibrio parahaemolyticus]EJL6568540.1 hypothetical protein [Vibrio navarrensis]AMG05473.1 hypothetical protein AL464_00805 [Vibrio parahaemolyticus]EGR0426987.1 hypothetical protein [Vibrio parahaemolyticus]KKI07771.1 hypothetical protein WU75_19415 [Vibrio parahaemolyticus]MBE5129676.1 hypothetical protein [Vibrio parahaemolyticus]
MTNFNERFNNAIDMVKLEKAVELSKRDSRFKEIFNIIFLKCKTVGFIDDVDRKNNTYKYKWLSIVIDIHLTAMMLTDLLDENDIPMDSDMIREDNFIKANQILENIILYLVASVPKLNGK